MQPIKIEPYKTQTLYKNEFLWAVNKPSLCHFNEVMTHSENKGWSPAHRLDFETSGVLLLAREEVLEPTRKLFQDPESSLKKIYIAGTESEIFTKNPETFRGFIGSRYRRSKSVKYEPDKSKFRGWHSVRRVSLAFYRNESLDKVSNALGFKGSCVFIELHTGARHQIRATCKYFDAPIIGDNLYNENSDRQGSQMELHAYQLKIPKDSLDFLNEDLKIEASQRFMLEAQTEP